MKYNKERESERERRLEVMIDRVCSSSLNSHTLGTVCLGGWFAGKVKEGTALGTLREGGREGGEGGES